MSQNKSADDSTDVRISWQQVQKIVEVSNKIQNKLEVQLICNKFCLYLFLSKIDAE